MAADLPGPGTTESATHRDGAGEQEKDLVIAIYPAATGFDTRSSRQR